MSLPQNQNDQFVSTKSRLNKELVHKYGQGRWIPNKALEELALEKYSTNGEGITFEDLTIHFRCSKNKAQRKLKNECTEKIDKNGKKVSILFTLDDKRTKPRQYFPTCIKTKIIENKRKRQNRLIDPTGANYKNKTSSYYPLHNAIEQQMVYYFLTQLSLLPFQPLNMHNIRLWMIIDKSHYEELVQKTWSEDNKTKVERERIGLREVIFKFNKKGSIEIEIACTENPFQIETDDDVNNFFVFLGQVKDRLANILMDPRERIVPSVDLWILKYCDFNKDVEFDDKKIGQLMDLNIQIKYAGKTFRLYVKNLEDRFVLRGEKVLKVDKPITTFLNDSIQHPFNLINNKLNELGYFFEKSVNEINARIDKVEGKTNT